MKLDNITAKINSDFKQARQYINESLNSPNGEDEITTLPEYRELEEKMDKIKNLYQDFYKVTKCYTRSLHDYDAPVTETISNVASKLFNSSSNESNNEKPVTLAQAIAKVSVKGSEAYTRTEPTYEKALINFGSANVRLGEAKIIMDNEITEKLNKTFSTTLNTNILFATKARKNVKNCIYTYTVCKNKIKNATTENLEKLKRDFEHAETNYVKAVEDAMIKMNAVIYSVEYFSNIKQFLNSQLEYHKYCYEVLTKLAPTFAAFKETPSVKQNSENSDNTIQ